MHTHVARINSEAMRLSVSLAVLAILGGLAGWGSALCDHPNRVIGGGLGFDRSAALGPQSSQMSCSILATVVTMNLASPSVKPGILAQNQNCDQE